MWEAIAKHVSGKVVGIIALFGCACAGYWFYRHPDDLQHLWMVTKYVFAWSAFVIVLPWPMFLVTRWVLSRDSNTANALMLGGYTIIDVIMALWMGGLEHNALVWIIFIAGFLAALVYNFLVCEYQSNLLEDF